MLGLLRRCRPLAIALLLAAPGLGGTWLSVVHPCVSDNPGIAAGGGEGAHHIGAAGHDLAAPGHGAAVPADGAPDQHSGTDTCHCIGACQAAAIAALGLEAAPIGLAPTPPAPAVVPAYSANPPARRHLDRHPPSTAPPVI